jgi:hypothetical protein
VKSGLAVGKKRKVFFFEKKEPKNFYHFGFDDAGKITRTRAPK